MGLASLNAWLSATQGTVQFLNNLTGRKVYIVGHSIGGPLAIQAAAGEGVNGMVAGVITYGGFSELYKMAKDNQEHKILKLFSKFIVKLTLSNNIINGVGNLEAMMDKSIPTLIMHGQNDGAVLPTHLLEYKKQKEHLAETKFEKSNYVATYIFPHLYHEEINNYSKVRPQDFQDVWTTIQNYFGFFSVSAPSLNIE